MKTQKTDQHKQSKKLTEELNKQGETLHREISTIIQRKQSEMDNMNAQHLTAIEKHEHEIYKTII